MKKNIKTVQIAFNLNDPYQKELYEYMLEKSDTNISNYGKMLVRKDMQGEWKHSADESSETISLDINRLI